MKKKVIIIGGGPAGMMAAIAAGKNGSEVLLLEQNKEVGKKLLITGNGRCNITNSASPREMLSHIYRNPKFLSHALQRFTNGDLLELLSSYGLKTKKEDNGRIFPISDKAEDVRNTLLTILKDVGVKIITGFQADSLIIEGDVCRGVRGTSKPGKEGKEGKEEKAKEYFADTIILASGGLAAPTTGSRGWGIETAKRLGHQVIEPMPGLSPLRLKGNTHKEIQGLSLKDIRVFIDKKRETRGDLIFTHFGISGPAAMKMSSLIWSDRERLMNEGDGLNIYLDSLPSISREELEVRIKEETLKQGNRQVRTILNDLAPKDFIRRIFTLCEIPEDRRLGDLSKGERNKLIEALKALPLEIENIAGFNQAMITSGGISTGEIDPKTMESKLVKNLRFAGEIIDVDAETGGYNLQIAWSTGWAAGNI